MLEKNDAVNFFEKALKVLQTIHKIIYSVHLNNGSFAKRRII